jgi:hypothetical protein
MTEPGHTPAADVDMTPRAADIEIVERHYGEKKPAAGVNSVICPNHMRINGVAVLATYYHPATIHEIELDGSSRSAFTVTVELLARAIAVGRAPTVEPRAEGAADSTGCAVVEIPDVDTFVNVESIDRPYVLLNGRPVWVEDTVRIRELVTDGPMHGAARVELKLLCRRLLVDDEPIAPASS